MKDLKYSQILMSNKELENMPYDNSCAIIVLSNVVTSQLKDILEYALRTHGVNASVQFGNYDNIAQDSNKFKGAGIKVIFWELANIIDGFHYKANLMDNDEAASLILKMKTEIDFVIAELKNAPLVFINKFSSLIFNYSSFKSTTLDMICSTLNDYAQKKVSSNFLVIDIDKILAKISISKSIDLRFYYSSKALYTVEFYKEYSGYITPLILSFMGKQKKAMIFDCDNTLWGGILEEEGFEGIKISGKVDGGAVFEEIQSIALELSRKGVLLGICSKNNYNDVEEVIKNHPEMKLRNENIVIKKINWCDKAENLKLIAKELNLGLDSIVFVDDSDFEVNYIKERLPEVTVLRVPQKIHEYPQMLRENSALFYNISETKEDGQRTDMYKKQLEREEHKNSINDLEDYLKSLNLTIRLFINEKSLAPRLAQLTQKTNQFNLTVNRYSESEVEGFISSKNYIVFAFEAKDKFGSYGITGLAILKLLPGQKLADIDTLLMSCRVIGRNLEFAFFDAIAGYLKKIGIQDVSAKYNKTPKNEQVQDLCERLGFLVISSSSFAKAYKLRLANFKDKSLNYIRITYGE